MNRSLGVPLLVAVVALLAGVAIFLYRADPAPPPQPATAPDPPAPAPLKEIPDPVEPAPVVVEPEADEIGEAKKVADPLAALLEALSSGDMDKIKAELETLRAGLIPDPVPVEENAALIYEKAFKMHSKPSDVERRILDAWWDGKTLTAEELEALRGLVERNRETIELLRQAAELPRSTYELDYTKGFATELPHLMPMASCSRILFAEALLADAEGIEGSLRTAHHLARSVADEPFLVSQLVRVIGHDWESAVVGQALSRGVSEAELRGVLERIRPESFREGMDKILSTEVYAAVLYLTGEHPEGQPLRLEDPLSQQDLAYYAETISKFAELANQPYYKVGDQLHELERSAIEGAPWYAKTAGMLLPSMSRAAEAIAKGEATLGVIKAAAAVRLYKLKNGSYPVALNEVAEPLPVDPFTGKPFHYRREGSGFIVYSVGRDGADGGGTRRHDVVFRSDN